MKHSTTFITVITLVAWVLSSYFMPTVHTDFPLINYLFRVAFPLATLSLALLLIHRHTNLAAVWGLAADHRLALRKAFLFCLPMLIGYGVMANLNIHASWRAVAWTIILAPVLEELVFRGFLFGQLFRFAGWGFIPAGLINALVFGALHLYQASDLLSAIGIFSVTAMGGMWFAWLYIEWDRNLWVPLFMHMLMNAWWTLFAAGTDAAGGWEANLFRGLTIAISVIVTIRRNKTNGGPRITRENLWRNPAEPMGISQPMASSTPSFLHA
ncbi:MAG: CPBP family intramembrane metalloprotease [Lewinellaceae bacterium]|nr:CPBP family intramembrane metalloprotease [Saprospiraceae bacterium]MCB9312217.1 CPBP family intramembrane metalloprotease [Lewinellaceae bacterium]HRW75730.1 CPBP family intramembrane metalloprotease [Saprospiraceae bacterium]